MLKVKVVNKDGNEMYISPSGDELECVFNFCYQDGDWMIIDSDKKNSFYKIQLERTNYSPKSFYGDCHIIRVKEASLEEVKMRRNLAFNPYDEHENDTFYPHSYANIETRGECVFASRNAIDGYYFNESHGSFPYQSWGINRDPKAEFTIDFGREVMIDEVVLTLRADFPHDNYWEKVTLAFSDGSNIEAKLEKTNKRQSIKFEAKKVKTITLKNLIKAKGVSEFPALTQFEAWGNEII